jgi:hypothetical protein
MEILCRCGTGMELYPHREIDFGSIQARLAATAAAP